MITARLRPREEERRGKKKELAPVLSRQVVRDGSWMPASGTVRFVTPMDGAVVPSPW